MKVTEFSVQFLDDLTTEAEQLSRLRKHRNLHHSYEDPCQRLFNAIGVNSYIRPHRHLLDPKTECLLAVRGLMTLVMFDASGRIANAIKFGVQLQSGETSVGAGVEIPPGIWHTVIADVPGSILFEVKAGPFDSGKAKEFADWAPEEGSLQAQEYLASLRESIAKLGL